MYSRTLLSNSLRVVTVPMAGVKSVTVLVMVGTGSRYETKNLNGISHFLEHLVFKGTKKRPTSGEIFSLLDGVGASHNAFTGRDHTGFYVKTAAKHLELALDVLSDVILNPVFDPRELEKERRVIVEEINMYEDEPQTLAGRVFGEMIFPNSPLGWRIEGLKENILRIDRQQVRDYVDKMYHSGSMVLGVAGKIGSLDLISKYFDRVPKGKKNNFLAFEGKQEEPRVRVHYKKTDQAHLILGLRALPFGHPDRFVLAVLANILGGNTSSRLFREVREKRGLAYYIGAGTEEYQDTGVLAVGAGVGLAAVSEAVRVIRGELNEFVAKPASAVELRRAKDYFAGRMLLRLEDTFNQAMMFASQELLEEKIETPEEILVQVEKVTAQDVQQLAKEIIMRQKFNLAIVGPFKDGEKFAKLLKL